MPTENEPVEQVPATDEAAASLSAALSKNIDGAMAQAGEEAGLEEEFDDLPPDLDEVQVEEAAPVAEPEKSTMDELSELSKALQATKDELNNTKMKYDIALDIGARGQAPAAPAPAPTQEQDPYDIYETTKKATPEQRRAMTEATQAAMLKSGFTPEMLKLPETVRRMESALHSIFIKTERQELENKLDKGVVDKYYNGAMKMVVDGKIATIEDGIMLLEAREKRSAPPPVKATISEKEQRQRIAAAPASGRKVPQPLPTAAPKDLTPEDTLRFYINKRLGSK